MLVRAFPMGIGIVPAASRDASVEGWMDLADPLLNVLVQLFLGNRPLPSPSLSLGLDQVQPVQFEIHSAQNDVSALQKNMLLGIDLDNVSLANCDIRFEEVLRKRHIVKKLFEFVALSVLIRQHVQKDDYVCRRAFLWNRHQAEGVLEKLIIELEVFIIHTRIWGMCRPVGNRAEHDPHLDFPCLDVVKEQVDQFYVFG